MCCCDLVVYALLQPAATAALSDMAWPCSASSNQLLVENLVKGDAACEGRPSVPVPLKPLTYIAFDNACECSPCL